MDYLTNMIAEAIRAYPSLYPNRIAVLQAMFSTSNYYIDAATGQMMRHDNTPRTWEPDADDGSFAEAKRNAEHAFIVENADKLADFWTIGKMQHISSVEYPFLGREGYQRATWDQMDRNAQDAFKELLTVYESTYDLTVHQDQDHIEFVFTSCSWNLNRPSIRKTFDGALKLLDEITGKTKEQRARNLRDTFNRIMGENNDT